MQDWEMWQTSFYLISKVYTSRKRDPKTEMKNLVWNLVLSKTYMMINITKAFRH